MEIKFTTETLRLMNIFEKITGANIKDCLFYKENNIVYFVVEDRISSIIGREGTNIKRIENILGKKIKIFEFSKDLKSFVKNLIPQAQKINVLNGNNGKSIVEVEVNKMDRAIVIGREGKNLKLFKTILQRNHNVEDLRVK